MEEEQEEEGLASAVGTLGLPDLGSSSLIPPSFFAFKVGLSLKGKQLLGN